MAQCEHCDAEILWVRSAKASPFPIDAKPVESNGNVRESARSGIWEHCTPGEGTHVSHHVNANCPGKEA